jgi:hypothetical protein
MSSLKYLGKQADTDTGLANRNYIDQRKSQMGVDQSQVDAEIDSQLSSRALKTYVDAQDATKALKTYVDTQDALYMDSSTLGAVNGVAVYGSDGKIPAAKLSNANSNVAFVAATGFTSTGNQTSGTPQMGTFTLPDPGYKWYPWVFAHGFTASCDATPVFRVDMGLYVGSYTGTRVAYGTVPINETTALPMSMVSDNNTASRTGAATFYLKSFRASGSSGSWSIGCLYGRITVVAIPVP